MKQSTQTLANDFNKAYIKATRTSDAEDYFKASLLGRQLVYVLSREGLIEDNFDDEFIRQEGE